jgi:hypothetical protein
VSEKVYYFATQNAAFAWNLPRFDIRSKLREIKVSMLMVVLGHDLVAPLAYNEDISDGIPILNRSCLSILDIVRHLTSLIRSSKVFKLSVFVEFRSKPYS